MSEVWVPLPVLRRKARDYAYIFYVLIKYGTLQSVEEVWEKVESDVFQRRKALPDVKTFTTRLRILGITFSVEQSEEGYSLTKEFSRALGYFPRDTIESFDNASFPLFYSYATLESLIRDVKKLHSNLKSMQERVEDVFPQLRQRWALEEKFFSFKSLKENKPIMSEEAVYRDLVRRIRGLERLGDHVKSVEGYVKSIKSYVKSELEGIIEWASYLPSKELREDIYRRLEKLKKYLMPTFVVSIERDNKGNVRINDPRTLEMLRKLKEEDELYGENE